MLCTRLSNIRALCSLARLRMAENMMNKSGREISIGKQPASGLTF